MATEIRLRGGGVGARTTIGKADTRRKWLVPPQNHGHPEDTPRFKKRSLGT